MLIDLFPDGLPTEHDDRWLAVVHTLLKAEADGLHRVVIRPQSLLALQGRFESEHGESGRRLLLPKLGEDPASRRGLLTLFPRHLRVVANPVETSTKDGPFVAHWTQLEVVSRCQGAALIGEGEDDLRFFVRLAEDTLRTRREGEGSPRGLDRLRVEFPKYRPGGGDQLARHVKWWVQEDGPVLAVVDSDRRRPGGGLGDTAKRAQKATQEVHDAAIALNLFIPEGWRNLENCVPEAVVEHVGKKKSPDSKDRISTLKALGALGLGKAPFLKLKDAGTSRKALISAGDADEARWLRELLGITDDPNCSNRSVAGSPLCVPNEGEGRKKEECRCPALVEGIRSLMTHALSVLSEDPEFKPGTYNLYDAHPEDGAREEFQRLGVELMSFGLAAERRRA
jgi:hypothetical protein